MSFVSVFVYLLVTRYRNIFFIFTRHFWETYTSVPYSSSNKKNKYYSPCFSPINSKKILFWCLSNYQGDFFILIFITHNPKVLFRSKIYTTIKFFIFIPLKSWFYCFRIFFTLFFYGSKFFEICNPCSFSFCFEIGSKCRSHRCESMLRNAWK